MINIKNLSQKFNKKLVLDDISLDIKKGDIHFVIGTSGTGKTVLVKHLVGLLKPYKGEIIFENKDITKLKEKGLNKVRKKITYVFQHSTLFDNLTLYENIELPLIKTKIDTHNHKTETHNHQVETHDHQVEMHDHQVETYGRASLPQNDHMSSPVSQLVEKYLKLVGIEEYKNKYPYEIGDSIKKRTAIARGLAMNPEYIIYDEPTTGLTFADARNIDNLIFEMSRKLNVTAIVISHDLKSIFSIADRITMLYQGKILLDGTKEDFKNSRNEIVQQFINGRAEGPI